MWKRLSWVVSLGVAGGCALSEVEPRESVVTALANCEQYGCPTNASSMGFELDVGPQHRPNGDGFAVTAIHAPEVSPYLGRSMKLELASNDLDALIGSIPGLTWGSPPTKLYNNQLIGTTLRFSRTLGGKTLTYELLLDGISSFDYMVGNPPDQVTSYLFYVRRVGSGDENWHWLCPTENDSVTASGAHHHALVFQGDRYDSQYKVSETTEPWINIACAGTASAKLHLLRHTKAGTGGSFSTTPIERQAMLQMLRADYCGDGTSYTADGTQLRYADSNNWHPDDLDVTQTWQRERFEALWNGNGAQCLDHPRLGSYMDVQCSGGMIPHCNESLVGWQTLAHVASAMTLWWLPPPENL
jgi:hypothetical protein